MGGRLRRCHGRDGGGRRKRREGLGRRYPCKDKITELRVTDFFIIGIKFFCASKQWTQSMGTPHSSRLFF
jgi:hypothetical protein